MTTLSMQMDNETCIQIVDEAMLVLQIESSEARERLPILLFALLRAAGRSIKLVSESISLTYEYTS